MSQGLKSFLIIFACALGQMSLTATPIVASRVPSTLDIWVISLAVMANIAGTTIALLTQSPLPRREWTAEERTAKMQPQVPAEVKP